MSIVSRDRIQLLFNDDVTASGTKTDTTSVIPTDETWQLSRIVCADKNIGDNLSGGFTVEWGETGDWEWICLAYLTGDTLEKDINLTYTGDGAKAFRVRRINGSTTAKNMVVMLEGFKRL